MVLNYICNEINLRMAEIFSDFFRDFLVVDKCQRYSLQLNEGFILIACIFIQCYFNQKKPFISCKLFPFSFWIKAGVYFNSLDFLFNVTWTDKSHLFRPLTVHYPSSPLNCSLCSSNCEFMIPDSHLMTLLPCFLDSVLGWCC